ncbi:hypothetical protein VCR4J5_710034 [Vibrio crassostreae]|uniref:Uncharacterized protein n=1 Tax=Vibrio crassostreae TaxID=246167 RepID=A0ABM9QXS7_9VIBR|nr:hypothetical protein [Vibrio crassostreae]CDT01250.1 hypothetical protein VCR20J5_1100022 [Vibrio crassostreae]CDT03093.1 hypothetical protein VCR15J5_20075 [Vibrio crassostreae]CDT15851.1 hypothetical protein VCR19J5_1290022 [Vibrio crassostreae]CDT56165.1 hypothetical protein VCR4J5_710034 [Vibrio crassostreae]
MLTKVTVETALNAELELTLATKNTHRPTIVTVEMATILNA